MTYEEIMAALKNGAEADTIAKEFADTLNKATAQYRADQQAEVKRKQVKLSDTEDILNEVRNYLKVYYPELNKLLKEKIDIKEFVELLDSLYEEVLNLNKICEEAGPELEKLIEKLDINKNRRKYKFVEKTGDPITDFLNQHGL